MSQMKLRNFVVSANGNIKMLKKLVPISFIYDLVDFLSSQTDVPREKEGK